jgi:DNA-binding transcriptional LysR family regulator
MGNFRFPRLDAYHLIIFFYVATEKSITAAAEDLSLSQPAVTNHIKSLEKSLNMKLIEVNRQRITLTPVGEGLANYAREVYRQIIQAERFVEMFKESGVNIGVSPLFTSAIASAINTLSQQWSSPIELKVNNGDSQSLIQDVIDSRIDLAIVPELAYETDKLSQVRISDGVKLVLYASPVHPVFKRSQIEWSDVCNYPVVIGPDTSSVPQILAYKLHEEGIQRPLIFGSTANNLECCKILVQNGKNLSMALKEDIEGEITGNKLKVISLPSDTWVTVNAIMHRGFMTSPIVQNFISCARASF